MATWYVYAEREDYDAGREVFVVTRRRFLGRHNGSNTGNEIFCLYADEAEIEEEIVIRAKPYTNLVANMDAQMAAIGAAALGRRGGAVKSAAKSQAASARNARRKAAGKPEGGRPRNILAE